MEIKHTYKKKKLEIKLWGAEDRGRIQQTVTIIIKAF